MRLQLLAVGDRMPSWVADGVETYAGRLPPELKLELRVVPTGDRGRGSDPRRARDVEGRRLLSAAQNDARRIALDASGRQHDSAELAAMLSDWMRDGRHVTLFIGGPDGLSSALLEACDQRWSLSRLTLPHMLVRVVVVEQLYRAWTMLSGHPYHR